MNEDRDASSALNAASETYWDVWKDEIEANGWEDLLLSKRTLAGETITILDISPTGDITEWKIHLSRYREIIQDWIRGNQFYGDRIRNHQLYREWIRYHQPIQDWIRSSRQRLQSHGSEDTTRLILFQEADHQPVMELIGLHYRVEPEFFGDVAYSYAARHEPIWFEYSGQLSRFMAGTSPRHLKFYQGWTGKILVNQESLPLGPRNTGKYSHSRILLYKNNSSWCIVLLSVVNRSVSSSAAILLHQIKSIDFRYPRLVEVRAADPLEEKDVDLIKVFISVLLSYDSLFRVLGHENPLIFLLPVLQIHASIL